MTYPGQFYPSSWVEVNGPARRVRAGETLAMTTMTFNGKTFEVDDEIASIVHALNAAGISTVASCSGHGMRPGRISLADGRELFVLPSYEIGQWFETQFPRDINGQTKEERAADEPSRRFSRTPPSPARRAAAMSESNSTIGDELLDEARATIDRVLHQRDQLLAALKAIVSNSMFEQKFDHCGVMNATALSDRDLFRKLWANARDAIEKAEGRSDE